MAADMLDADQSGGGVDHRHLPAVGQHGRHRGGLVLTQPGTGALYAGAGCVGFQTRRDLARLSGGSVEAIRGWL